MPILPRYNSTASSTAIVGGKEIQGDFRTVLIDPFPEGITEIRLYARAWGHTAGALPEHKDNSVIGQIVSAGDDIAQFFFPQSDDTYAKAKSTLKMALMFVWKNGELLNGKSYSDFDFMDYNLMVPDVWSTDVPEAGSKFEWRAQHTNRWAHSDGFEVFVELKSSD